MTRCQYGNRTGSQQSFDHYLDFLPTELYRRHGQGMSAIFLELLLRPTMIVDTKLEIL